MGQVKQSTTGIIIFGHGSSVPSANAAVARVAAQAAVAGNFPLSETAFLECAPTLRDATASLVGQGANDLLVIPYFLTLGIHLQRDLPNIIKELVQEFAGISMRVTPPLDGHAALSGILVDRAREAMADSI